MARLIVRTSINGPSPNNKQQELRKLLTQFGFSRIGTGAYEGELPSDAAAYAALHAALDFLEALPAGFSLDHLWVYVDGPDFP
jgi:hypothetical protein